MTRKTERDLRREVEELREDHGLDDGADPDAVRRHREAGIGREYWGTLAGEYIYRLKTKEGEHARDTSGGSGSDSEREQETGKEADSE